MEDEVDKDIFLSIIIPAYNCELYLDDCIESIMASIDCCAFKNAVEIIIVNDGSNDETQNKSIELENRYPQVKAINQKNQGVSVARNNGMFIANGKYITFVDGDDYVNPEEYKKVCETVYSTDNDVICFGMTELTDGQLHGVEFKKKEVSSCFVKYPKYMNSVCNKFFKKTLLDSEGILFNDKLKTCEDLLFVVSCFVDARKILYLDNYAYIYRRNMASVTKKHNRMRESRDELFASNMIETISQEKGRDEFIQVSQYWKMVSAMRNLKDVEIYDVEEYRKKNPKKLTWNYSFKPSYWIISFFANLKMDFVPNIYISLKRRKYD